MLLIHSPLVGPSSWSTLSPVASASGSTVATGDVTGVAGAAPPPWQWFLDAAVLGNRCTMTVFVEVVDR